LDRRTASRTLWEQIEQEIQVGVPPGPLESASAFVAVLVDTDRRRSVTVQYDSAMPLELSSPDATVTNLDTLLGSFVQGSPAAS
jgi:hypothetical protein